MDRGGNVHRPPGGIAGLCLVATLVWAVSLAVAAQETEGSEIFDLDLEDLVNVTITSVSKRAERAAEAAAAVHVLTGEDIRRSGIRTVPDALRSVPGLHVAQLSGNRWSVSSRGFGNLFSDKLLVLMDGRSVYTPLFAGVYWDVQNLLLEDVDRIEVIRGPGGTLWGSNAVNGVINIVTKRAEESQGTYLHSGGGWTEKLFAEGRYGGRLGEIGHWRWYGKYFQHAGLEDNGATPDDDPTDQVRVGFRSDFSTGDSSDLTIQGDVYHGHSQAISSVPDPATLQIVQGRADGDVAGGNVLARSTFRFSGDSEASAQVSYDVTDRDDGSYDYRRGTLDVDVQHQFRPFDFANLTWGGGYRRYRDDLDPSFHIRLDPERRTFDLLNGFAQTELQLLEGKLRLIAGTKLERNDFTGAEHQPSARLAFLPTPKLTLWAAASRAARTPSRAETDGFVTALSVLPPTTPLPTEVQLTPSDSFSSEDLTAYEIGVRVRPTDAILVDVAAFQHHHDRIRTAELAPLRCTDGTLIVGAASIAACALGGNRLRQATVADNRSESLTRGIEALLRLQLTDFCQVDLSYTYFHGDFHQDADSTADASLFDDYQWPDHQASVRSRMNLAHDLTLDVGLFYVDELSAIDVDAYFRLDVRLGWSVTDRIELALVGQNLIEEHEEFGVQPFFLSTRVPRIVFATVTWQY